MKAEQWLWRAVAGVVYALVFVATLTLIERWWGVPDVETDDGR